MRYGMLRSLCAGACRCDMRIRPRSGGCGVGWQGHQALRHRPAAPGCGGFCDGGGLRRGAVGEAPGRGRVASEAARRVLT